MNNVFIVLVTSTIFSIPLTRADSWYWEPSFDCAKAIKISEKEICGHTLLSSYDRYMGKVYRDLVFQEGDSNYIESQREFLRFRDGCKDNIACIKNAYSDRIRTLEEAISEEKPPKLRFFGIIEEMDSRVGNIDSRRGFLGKYSRLTSNSSLLIKAAEVKYWNLVAIDADPPLKEVTLLYRANPFLDNHDYDVPSGVTDQFIQIVIEVRRPNHIEVRDIHVEKKNSYVRKRDIEIINDKISDWANTILTDHNFHHGVFSRHLASGASREKAEINASVALVDIMNDGVYRPIAKMNASMGVGFDCNSSMYLEINGSMSEVSDSDLNKFIKNNTTCDGRRRVIPIYYNFENWLAVLEDESIADIVKFEKGVLLRACANPFRTIDLDTAQAESRIENALKIAEGYEEVDDDSKSQILDKVIQELTGFNYVRWRNRVHNNTQAEKRNNFQCVTIVDPTERMNDSEISIDFSRAIHSEIQEAIREKNRSVFFKFFSKSSQFKITQEHGGFKNYNIDYFTMLRNFQYDWEKTYLSTMNGAEITAVSHPLGKKDRAVVTMSHTKLGVNCQHGVSNQKDAKRLSLFITPDKKLVITTIQIHIVIVGPSRSGAMVHKSTAEVKVVPISPIYKHDSTSKPKSDCDCK